MDHISDVIILIHGLLCIVVWTAGKQREKWQWLWICFVLLVSLIFYVNASMSLGFRAFGFFFAMLPIALLLLKRLLKEAVRKSGESKGVRTQP